LRVLSDSPACQHRRPPREPVNLGKVIREVISDLEVQIEEVKAVIDVEDLPTITANAP